MKHFLLFIPLLLVCFSCKETNQNTANSATEVLEEAASDSQFTMVFASCNDQDREQPLWNPILDIAPDLFVWGGDNIYSDTEDMAKMKADYDKVKANPEYASLMASTPITGTWDDHDYGMNDAGFEYPKKDEAQQLALDFLGASEDDPRRGRAGLYTSEVYEFGDYSLKLILLDTRYFRTPLKKSETEGRRYDEWTKEDGGTLLGDAQWEWLEDALDDDTHDFTVIVSSIQFLNNGHGWEKWGNHPGEMERMYTMLQNAKAKNIMILSGDRHLAEISVDAEAGLSYPLVDFTASGMTHTWIDGATERNVLRISNVIKRLNFGVLIFDAEKNTVTFQIRGEDNFLYEEHLQQY